MNLLVDVAIILVLVTAAYAGFKQGAILVSFEIMSLSVATALAFALYKPVGGLIHQLGSNRPLSNVVAFVVLWVVLEIAGAVLIRLLLLRRVRYAVHMSRPNRLGGSFLNVIKYSVLVTLSIITLTAIPGLPTVKTAAAESFLGGQLLIVSAPVKQGLAHGIGRDLSEGFNFYTVTTDAESSKRIDLEFTTTGTINEKAESAMLKQLNHERLSHGLPPLRTNVQARGAARAYATTMFAEGFFSHIDNQGRTPFDRLKAAGVTYQSAGENLALAPTVELAHQGLMNSPGHRANILSPRYHTVGIGIIDGGPYGLMVVQAFTD
jgi:uncharacterized protein YkwD/uncharacterized membrane protein required for colicin V production